ncbi:hypothetical protein FXO38_32785 [Capsicum annuum]|nr:ribonuclease MC [Capsicum annuum]KAF3619672.1 hypothetical protein FXO38_32785 [Capsicum annuum]KAF3624300.1 hypothetical protein FXO37_31454 [Capsicum annuum]
MEHYRFKTVVFLLVQLLSVRVMMGQNSYDLMAYVVQWKSTFCKTNHCKRVPLDTFSIHGLWPANATGHSMKCPQGAGSDVDTLMKKDRKLETALKAIWPNLLAAGNDRRFWKHEWTKHGFCSNKSLPIVAYFNGAVMVHNNLIAINNKNNLRDYLAEGGVRPSTANTYNKQVIITAVQRLVGANNNVYVACKVDSHNKNVIYLKEIHLCLDTTLRNFVSCPTANPDLRECGNHTSQIIIPV